MRKLLKIAVTAFSLAACLALVALWALSYPYHGQASGPLPNSTWAEIQVSHGSVHFMWIAQQVSPTWQTTWIENFDMPRGAKNAPTWFYASQPGETYALFFPIWFPALIFAMLAAVPWLKFRFTVRTLLVAMGVVALVLGVAVWGN